MGAAFSVPAPPGTEADDAPMTDPRPIPLPREAALAALRATVVGAGIAGLATALALGRRGADVAVLEQAPEIAEVGAEGATPHADKAHLRELFQRGRVGFGDGSAAYNGNAELGGRGMIGIGHIGDLRRT